MLSCDTLEGIFYDVQGRLSMHDFMVECAKKDRAGFNWAAVFHMLQCNGEDSDQVRWTYLRMKGQTLPFAIRATQGHSVDMKVTLGNLHRQLTVAEVKTLKTRWHGTKRLTFDKSMTSDGILPGGGRQGWLRPVHMCKPDPRPIKKDGFGRLLPLSDVKFSGHPVDAEINIIVDARRMLYWIGLSGEDDDFLTPFYQSTTGASLTDITVPKESVVVLESNDHYRIKYWSTHIPRGIEGEDYLLWMHPEWDHGPVSCNACHRNPPQRYALHPCTLR